MTLTRTGLALAVTLAVNGLVIGSTFAQVSPDEAAKLGKELTCVGAEQAGNAAGTIPPYTGKYLGEVPGWNHVKFSGDQPIDPYAAEKPILVITAQNMDQYADKLTEGQKALFKRYPTTYKMNIYTGHRDYRYPDYVCKRVMSNALRPNRWFFLRSRHGPAIGGSTVLPCRFSESGTGLAPTPRNPCHRSPAWRSGRCS